jgi:RHS repeat-associated protein
VGTGTNVATYTYLANSPLVEQITFTHGNTTNMVTTKAYDYINRLTAISHADLQPVTLASYSYGYNGANQRTNVTHADDSYWTFGYDSLGQVISGKQGDDQDALLADRQFEYDFDDIGNRQAHRLDGSAGGVFQTTNTYAANLLNQYTNIAGASSAHDADGNLSNDTNWAYTWNGENRLVGLESSTNVPAGSRKKLGFAYDHQGRRTSKTVSTWNLGSSDWDLSYQRYFVYDGWNLIVELDGNTTVVNSVVWGLDLSNSEQGAGGVGGLLMLTDSGANTHFVGHDGNGNVTRLVDSSLGTITASYEYSPFGKRLSATGTMALVNPFRFSNKYEDDESGFNYYGYRYYNPDTGRWLSRDPISESGGLNIYAFVWNSIPNVIDYLGMDSYRDEVREDFGWTDAEICEWSKNSLFNVTTAIALFGPTTQLLSDAIYWQDQIDNHCDDDGDNEPVPVPPVTVPEEDHDLAPVSFWTEVLCQVPGSDGAWLTVGTVSGWIGQGAAVAVTGGAAVGLCGACARFSTLRYAIPAL